MRQGLVKVNLQTVREMHYTLESPHSRSHQPLQYRTPRTTIWLLLIYISNSGLLLVTFGLSCLVTCIIGWKRNTFLLWLWTLTYDLDSECQLHSIKGHLAQKSLFRHTDSRVIALSGSLKFSAKAS